MKLQINVSDEMVERIDEYAQSIGVSRSALCAVWLGQAMNNVDNQKNILNQLGMSMSSAFDSALKNEVSTDVEDKK